MRVEGEESGDVLAFLGGSVLGGRVTRIDRRRPSVRTYRSRPCLKA